MTTNSHHAAQLALRAVEPIHGMIYFTPHGPAAYRKLGLEHPRGQYFASRSAAMGAASAELVTATFFNFNPEIIHAVIPHAWSVTTPEQLLAARLEAVDASLRQAWGDRFDSAEVRETAALLRRAAERACERPQGRALFAGHASLPWPDEPHLVLWHAQTLLREYRGDSHVSLLHSEDVEGIEALILHAAMDSFPSEVLRESRHWGVEDWEAAQERLRLRGWLRADAFELTRAGREHRQQVEDRTDLLAWRPYEALSADEFSRMLDLVAPLADLVVEADLNFPPALVAKRKAFFARTR